MSLSAARSASNTRAELITLLEADLAEVSSFIARQSARAAIDVESRLRWFLLENPARQGGTLLGHGLRAPGGELVGCILCVPQNFRYGNQTFLLMGSSSFYVDEGFRGNGGLIFLKYSDLGRNLPLFGNSANADAAQLWKARGAIPIENTDHELFGVIRWTPIVEEVLARSLCLGRLARTAGGPISSVIGPFVPGRNNLDESGTLTPLSSAEEAAKLTADDLPNVLTANRNREYLHWRYFSGRDSTSAVFSFHGRVSNHRVMVAVNQRPRGFREQIKTLNLLDIYPQVTPETTAAIVGSLWRNYATGVDAIVLRGMNPERQAYFQRLGFKRRKFEAPNGWLLDRYGHLPTRNGYFVPGDGDWLS